MKKNFILMTVLSLLSAVLMQNAKAQEKLVLLDDTLEIGEVKVVPELPDGATGFKMAELDSDLVKTLSAGSIANILSIGTPLYIKSYGEGGTATSSFRGMGASHTQVLWEGIRIDNSMTGQTDLSTLITAFIDNVKLYSGGTPMSFANRGAGGTVALESKPVWDKGTGLEYIQRLASFSGFTENIDFLSSSSAISYRLRAYHQKSENNYEYNDIFGDNDVLRREGAGYLSKGMMHELNMRTNNTVFGARLWYNKSDRDLPGSIEYPAAAGNEKQSDESIRGILLFTSYLDKMKVEGKIAYNSDWMHYLNEMWGTNSRNQVKSVNGRLIGSYIISENSDINFGLDLRSTRVNTNNYENDEDRTQLAAEITYTTLIKKRLGLFASVNQEIVDKDFLRISPSAGFDLGLSSNKDYHLKGTIGLSNHLPTMNDLYWLPGGNPDLETERALNLEASFSFSEVLGDRLLIEGNLTGYQSVIDNMIQWVPVSEYVWSPENVVEVLSKGLEIEQAVAYKLGMHAFKLIGSFKNTNVSSQNPSSDGDNTVGKQLMYVPRNKASLSAVYKIEDFIFTWNSLFTGERFVSGDNSESLPSYWLSSASVKQTFNIRGFELGAGFNVNNIFNKDYQSIRYYPMPWRSYMLTLSLKFNTRKS